MVNCNDDPFWGKSTILPGINNRDTGGKSASTLFLTKVKSLRIWLVSLLNSRN